MPFQRLPLLLITLITNLLAVAQVPFGLPEMLELTAAPALNQTGTVDFSIEIDTVAVDIGLLSDEDLTGFNTYRLYVTTSESTDQISAIYGNIDEPSLLTSTGSIFQSHPIGNITSDGINPEVWDLFPSNEFDSYVTIGLEFPANTAEGEGSISILESSTMPWTEAFEPGDASWSNGFALNDITGGSWYTLPNFNNGIAGDDLRVLIAQITTDGVLSGNLHAQIFLEGDNLNGTVYIDLPIPIAGCMDSLACNYQPGATLPGDPCSYALPGLDCTGACLNDFDLDGICDGDEVEGCTYASACNFDPEATEEDGSCTFPGPGLDCQGQCLIDLDGDDICDQDDPCVGTVDACGVCNGPGAIQECGCTPLPDGDCDCVGNVLDAIGVCGGDCTADSDGDGVCDSAEIEGCTDGEACNFNVAATEENGTCTYPQDGLDCAGNCLEDADGDGVCDDQEISGCTESSACNFAPAATDDDGSCLVPDDCSTCEGSELLDFDSDDDGVCDGDEIDGCTDPDAPNFNPAATEDDGTCKVFGCTDMNAGNYDPSATDEDGSCQHLCTGIAGCAYPDAENFNPEALCDNGTCTFDCGDPGSCIFDQDDNGYIGSYDLIFFLTYIGLPCAE